MTEKFCREKVRSGIWAGGDCGLPVVPGFGVCYRHADVEKMAAKIVELESHLAAIRSTRWKCEHGHPIDLRAIVEACKPESAKEISEEERKKMTLAWFDALDDQPSQNVSAEEILKEGES